MRRLQAAVCRLQQAEALRVVGPRARVGTTRSANVARALELGAVGAVLLTVGVASAAEPAAPTLLHEVTVETTGELPPKGFGPVRVTLLLGEDGAQRPNLLLKRQRATLKDGALVIDLRSYPGGTDPAQPEHTASSFVIDHQAKAFDPLRATLPKDSAALRSYAAKYIEKKNLTRGYDAASVVAERKEGDCTEHAVFLAAILRARKIPARVVHGLVLLRVEGKPRAFGHAWVEVRGKKGWTPLDAALDVDPSEPIYLPLALMENEGPAHSLEAMGKLSPADVLRVRIEAN